MLVELEQLGAEHPPIAHGKYTGVNIINIYLFIYLFYADRQAP